jgi:hypothetical protein
MVRRSIVTFAKYVYATVSPVPARMKFVFSPFGGIEEANGMIL